MGTGYQSSFGKFLSESSDKIIGMLTDAASLAGHARHWHSQTSAWREQLGILHRAVAEVVRRRKGASIWTMLLEYEIPQETRTSGNCVFL